MVVSTSHLEEYDYIVVGGGTSGPVTARRLAEGDPNAQVLLVEAGYAEGGIASSMAMGWAQLHKTERDWGYDTQPQKALDGRVVNIPRGKFLGGCSGLNGMLMIRGSRADYDEWEQLGNPGWGWNDVLPLFKKSETFHPTEGFEAANEHHGTDGFLHTTVHPLAPISEALIDSYMDKGFDYKPDMFVEGEGEGVGHVTRTVHEGVRTSGADFVTRNPPSNLHVLIHTTIHRVTLEPIQGATPSVHPTSKIPTTPTFRATAIEGLTTIPPAADATGEDATKSTEVSVKIRARKEIILTAGAYNTPVILMHSGIGPKEHLEEVFADNKTQDTVKVDLKGVGSGLMDHLIVFAFYGLNSNMTYDHLIYPTGALDTAVKEWMENKSGVMGRFPFGPFAYKRMDNLMKDKPEWKAALAANPDRDPMGQLPGQPHIEYFSTELYGGKVDPTYKQSYPSDPSHSAFAMITLLCGPQSKGTVRLSSSDPNAKPIIDHAYLSDPAGLDVAMLAEGTRFAHEIALEGAGTKQHIKGAWPPERVHPDGDDEWKQYVREQAGTCYHPGGTARMAGDITDEWGVVDERLRVRGVAGLRVADVSIMPKLNNGHTQAPAYMIGEKAALLVLEDNDSRSVTAFV